MSDYRPWPSRSHGRRSNMLYTIFMVSESIFYSIVYEFYSSFFITCDISVSGARKLGVPQKVQRKSAELYNYADNPKSASFSVN